MGEKLALHPPHRLLANKRKESMADKFKSISVPESDYQAYEKDREEIIKELGLKKLSLADVVRMGMTFYRQRRKLPQYQDEKK